MGAESVIRILRKNITAENLPHIISGLRHDPLAWDSLSDPILMGKLLNFASTERKFWTPANIAILSVADFDPEQFVLFAPESWTPILQENVKSALSQTSGGKYQVKNIAQAAFLALGLKNRYRENLNWKETFSFATADQKENFGSSNNLQTVAAILFGMVTDPQQFIRVILDELPQGKKLAIHAVLSQPFDEVEQLTAFKTLASSLSIEDAIDLLAELENEGSKGLVEHLAKILIASSGFEEEPESGDDSSIKQMNLLSQLYQLAGEPKKAVEILNQAKNLLAAVTQKITKNKSRIALYKMDESAFPENINAELDEIVADEKLTATANGLIRQRQLSDQELSNLEPEIQILYAVKSEKNDARKKTITGEAVARIIESGAFSSSLAKPTRVLDALEKIGNEEAFTKLQKFLFQINGTDKELVKSIRDNNIKKGNIQQAEEAGQLVAAIDPQDCSNRRTLGSLYTKTGDWEDAFNEYQYVVAHQAAPSVEDRVILAEIAYHTDRIKEAKTTLEEVLHSEPENIKALIWAGKVHLRLSDFNSAGKCFKAATDLDPESTQAWEGLAEYFHAIGDEAREIETLKKGLQFAPESGSMNYRISQIYLNQDRFTEALPYLQKAIKLVPDTCEIALDLTKSLRGTGRMEEAAEVIGNARQKWPADPSLAYEEGEINYFNKKLDKAVNSFQFAIHTLNPKTEWFWQYARTLVELEEAEELPKNIELDEFALIGKVVSEEMINDSDSEKRFILAKVAFFLRKYQQASAQYKALFASPQTQTDFWKSRIQIGMGQAALKDGMTEVALAALKEADARICDNLLCKKLLAETYYQSGLSSDAEAVAAEVPTLLPVQISNLLWYARFMEKLGNNQEAIRTYSEITEMSSGDAATLLECAQAYQKSGNNEKSSELIRSILQTGSTDPSLLSECASLADKLNETEIAIAFLENAMNNESSQRFNNRVMKAVLESKRGNYTEAINSLDAISGDISLHSGILAVRAEIMAEAGDYLAAIEDLKKSFLVAGSRVNTDTLILLPDKWKKEIGSDQAKWATLSKWAAGIEKIDDAFTFAENSLNLDPENISTRAMAAGLACRLADFDKLNLLAQIHQITETKSTNTELSHSEKNDLASVFAMQSFDLFESGEYQTASKMVRAALELNPENPVAKVTEFRIGLEESSISFKDMDLSNLKSDVLGLSQFLVDVEQWEKGLQTAEGYLSSHPLEPLAHLEYLKAFIRTSEDAQTRNVIGFASDEISNTLICNSRMDNAKNSVNFLQNRRESSQVHNWIARYELLSADTVYDVQSIALDTSRPDHCRAISLAYWKLNEFELASETAKLFPRDPELNILRTIAMTRFDAPAAIKAGQWTVENAPDNVMSHIAFAKACEKAGDFKTSLQAFERAIELKPEMTGLQESAASVSQALGDPAAILQHLTAAVKATPSNENLNYELSAEYLAAGQVENAEELLKNYLVNFGKSARIALLLANTYLTEGNHQAAIVQAEAAAEVADPSVNILLDSSRIMLRAGELQKAFELSRKAASFAPESPEVILQIAKVVAERNSKEQALQLIEKAIEKGQVDFQLFKARALYSYDTEDESVSLPKLESASQMSQDGEIFSKLASIHFQKENMAKAKEFSLAAITAGNPLPEVDAILGSIYHAEGNLDKAVFHLSKAIESAPAQPDAYMELSEVYRARRDYKQASEVLGKAIEHVPADIALYTTLAGLLKEGKDYQGSEFMLRKAMELAPEDLTIRRQLGAIIALNLIHTSPEVRYAYER